MSNGRVYDGVIQSCATSKSSSFDLSQGRGVRALTACCVTQMCLLVKTPIPEAGQRDRIQPLKLLTFCEEETGDKVYDNHLSELGMRGSSHAKSNCLIDYLAIPKLHMNRMDWRILSEGMLFESIVRSVYCRYLHGE